MTSSAAAAAGLREFDAFCAVEHRRLVGAVGLYCGDAAIAEDVAQEALARACARWEVVGRMESPSAWVQRVAINVVHSHFRRQALRRRLDPRSAPSSDQHAPDPGDAVAVRQALATVNPRVRLAIVLRYFLDYTVAQTAATMGVPQNTVKTWVRRGLAEMRPLLGDDDWEVTAHA